MEMQPISREGYEKLREEIRRLEDEEMPKIAAQIAAARLKATSAKTPSITGSEKRRG